MIYLCAVQQNNNQMQDLYQLIKERYLKLHILIRNNSSIDQYRQLKQQQRVRAEKQSWIMSIFRSKKLNMNENSRNNYFRYSYEIMKIIDPNFVFGMQPNLSDETFLNDFVCLYTKFFDNYEDKFQFKVKVRNLLRPTNHNIINDMIKYLADFSRDYCQHIFLWQLKQVKRKQQIAEQNLRKASMTQSNSHSIQSVIIPAHSNSNNSSYDKEKPLQSFRNSVNITEVGIRKYNQDIESESNVRKNEFNKAYGILDTQPLPSFVFIQKIKSNVDILRLRMNQLYRDSKYRNNFIKTQIVNYYTSFQNKFNPGTLSSNMNANNKPSLIEDSYPFVNNPYRVSLVIQRNGFSCINVTAFDRANSKDDRNLSPVKEKLRLSSLSNNDIVSTANRTSKNQFVLNSMKVLRVSQNFLPPLQSRKQSIRINSEEEGKKQTSESKKVGYTSNTENLMNLQVEASKQQNYTSHNGMIYYNQELLREAERRKIQKRRITEMRKHFTSEERYKQKNKKSDPEEKIVEWLDKINLMKQIERKKILGLG